MTSVAPYPPAYDDQAQPFQRPSGGPYEPPPYFEQRPSGGFYPYPPSASYPPGYPPAYPPGYPPGYPPSYYGYPRPSAPPQQQQQQSVVVVNAGARQQVVGYYVPYMSFAAHKTVACISMWCCGFIFGLIGFILAWVAESAASDGDVSSARCLGHASMSVSVIGMVIFLIIVMSVCTI